MNRTRQARMPAKGFTVVELMVSITVVAILAAIALPNLRSFIQNSRRDSTVDALVASLNYARSQAIDLDQTVYFCAGTGGVASGGTGCATGGAWSSGWDIVSTPIGATTGQVFATHAMPAVTTAPTVNAISNSNLLFQFNGNGTVLMTGSSEVLAVCDARGASYARTVEVNTAGFIQSSSQGQSFGAVVLKCPG